MWDTVASVAPIPANGIKWHSTSALQMVGAGAQEHCGGGGGDTYSKWWFEKRLFLNVTLRTAVFCFTEKEVESENRG